jgi:hypothetical protein
VRSLHEVVVAFALALTVSAPAAGAEAAKPPSPPAHDVDAIDQTAKNAYTDGKYAFCTDPSRPLGIRQQGLCPLAAETEGCEGLVKACNLREIPKDRSWLQSMAEWLAPLAKALLYVLVLGIVVVVAVPVIQAILKRRRDRNVVERAPKTTNRAVVVEEAAVLAEEISDAEAALRLAEEHRGRGELDKALGLYLAASLAALDRRGAIRIARHRTNGEYVRGCEEAASRSPLREIVREVDKVEFGGAAPTEDGVQRVATRAQAIVRVTTTIVAVIALALVGGGCSPPRRGADPAGNELPIEVLERNGFKVGSLAHSLATMPIPEGDHEGAPVVIVDVEKVPLEDEAQAHMMRWVEAGGALVLFGRPEKWPTEIDPTEIPATTRDLVVRTPDPNAGLEDMESEDSPDDVGAPIEVEGARTARLDAFTWKKSKPLDAETVALLGRDTYAAKRHIGKGLVLGVANDDLFTNIGMMHARNPAALVTMIRTVSHDPTRPLPVGAGGVAAIGDIRVARTEDGVPPPSNPFAALIAAGLGKPLWHAVAAALVLFLAFGIRHARPRPSEKKGRRAFAEHVEATGAFYGKAHAHTHALGAYGRFVEMRLRESMPRGADPAVFLASRSGADPERAAELYARATKVTADEAPRGDELEVIEELRRMMAKTLEKTV